MNRDLIFEILSSFFKEEVSNSLDIKGNHLIINLANGKKAKVEVIGLA